MTLEEITKLHTITDLATAARVTRQTVYNWITKGVVGPRGPVKLAATKVGGQYLIHADSLAAFVAARNEWPATPIPMNALANERRAESAARALRERVG